MVGGNCPVVVGEHGGSVVLGGTVEGSPGRVVGGTKVVPGEPVVVGPPGTVVPGEAVVVVGHGPTPPPGSGQAATVVVGFEPDPTVVVGPVVGQPKRWRRAAKA